MRAVVLIALLIAGLTGRSLPVSAADDPENDAGQARGSTRCRKGTGASAFRHRDQAPGTRSAYWVAMSAAQPMKTWDGSST